MKKTLLLSIAATLISSLCFATIRRVGFFGNQIAGQDFADFTAASTAASPGDTILVFPGQTISATVSKKLIIIGYGNWLDPATYPKGNANQQALAGYATISSLTLENGSDNTVVTGFSGGTIYVSDADNITIKRNSTVTIYAAYGGTNTCNNLQVLQNYKVYFYAPYAASTLTNLNISNNLIDYLSCVAGSTYSGLIANNLWAYDGTLDASLNGGASSQSSTSAIGLGGGAFLFQNNLIVSYTNADAASNTNYFTFTDAGNTIFNYNTTLQSYNFTAWGAGTGNTIVPIANVGNIFENFPAISTNSADGRYRLKVGSPALTANRPGSSADAGMYGGGNPYKLSTIPTTPTIFSLSSPQGNNPSGSTLQINVSAKGNN